MLCCVTLGRVALCCVVVSCDKGVDAVLSVVPGRSKDPLRARVMRLLVVVLALRVAAGRAKISSMRCSSSESDVSSSRPAKRLVGGLCGMCGCGAVWSVEVVRCGSGVCVWCAEDEEEDSKLGCWAGVERESNPF